MGRFEIATGSVPPEEPNRRPEPPSPATPLRPYVPPRGAGRFPVVRMGDPYTTPYQDSEEVGTTAEEIQIPFRHRVNEDVRRDGELAREFEEEGRQRSTLVSMRFPNGTTMSVHASNIQTRVDGDEITLRFRAGNTAREAVRDMLARFPGRPR